MNKSELKDYILNNIMTDNNTIKPRSIPRDWWEKRNVIGIYEEILKFGEELNISRFIQICYHINYDIDEVPVCEVCNKKPKIFFTYTKGYKKTCSEKCSKNHPDCINQRKETCLNKYGMDHVSKLQEVKDKKKNTTLANYGVSNPSQVKSIQDKKIQTCLDRYGETSFSKSQQYKQKFADITPELRDSNWIVEQNKVKSVLEIAESLNVSRGNVQYWMGKHNIDVVSHNSFKEQNDISEYMEELGFNIKRDDKKIIAPQQLDIYIPEKNLAIELNGVYWHSTQFKKHKKYHYDKLKNSEAKGIRLLQFWDVEWNNKKDVCKSIIKSSLGLNKTIYARQCIIKDLTVKEYKDFLEVNHIQGYAVASIKYGLFFNGEIVACMSFSKSKRNKNYTYELVRYCNKINHTVVGGFSKLFKNSNLNNIISYCDLRLFKGDIYKSVGFNLEHTSNPNYFYFKNDVIYKREKCQKHKLKNILNNFDNNKSEMVNMIDNGWNVVYDCGNTVWSYNN